MNVLLDSTFLIGAERNNLAPADVVKSVKALGFAFRPVISVITIMELAHGETRAETAFRASTRILFLTEMLAALEIADVTPGIARQAGRLDGALSKAGNKLAFADLLIGSTAIAMDATLLTRNPRHFNRIPGLRVLVHA